MPTSMRMASCPTLLFRITAPRFWILLTALSTGLVVGGSPGTGFGENDHSPSGLAFEDRALTDSVIVASSEFQKADPSERGQALARLANAAKRRHERMLRLMEENPQKFLMQALPTELKNAMPANVQPDIEQEAEIEGVAYVLHEDRRVGSRYLYFLQGAFGNVAMHFAEHPPVLRTGTRIKVKGMKLDNVMAVGGTPGSVQTLAASAPLISGAQSTAVIMVNFSDKSSSYTADQIKQVVFTSTSDFHKENSYQQAWLTGNVLGPYNISLPSGACDYNTLATMARNAATSAGASLAAYKRFVYVFPQNACQWWGLGTVGGNPSHAWINGTVALQVVGHEIGHNYGLYHSHALECGSVTIGSTCSNVEYGDTVDIMGTSTGHYNAYQKERLGWLNTTGTPPISTANSGGQYLIDALETPGTNAKALKIQKSVDVNGKKTWYYIEYRQPLGFDGFLSTNTNVKNGVVIHTGSEASPDTSYLLDMTPATASWADPALGVQQTYQDPQAGVGLSVAWVTGTTAAVNVTTGNGPPPCVRAKPELAVSPASGMTVQAGKPATYTITVTNKDNAGCTASAFSIGTTSPSGWTGTMAVSPLSINPGASASTTVTITSPNGTTSGAYDIPIGVKNNADNAQSSTITARYIVATLCALNSPKVTVTPTGSGSGKRGQSVSYTVTVLNNNSPGCAASSFKLTVSKPMQINLSSISPSPLSIASGANGKATLVLSGGWFAGPGAYAFTVTATNSATPAVTGSGAGTITVLQ